MNYKQLAKLNAACFGADDELSSEAAMLEFDTTPHHGIFVETEKGKILGYVLHYITCDDTITIYRSGVSRGGAGFRFRRETDKPRYASRLKGGLSLLDLCQQDQPC